MLIRAASCRRVRRSNRSRPVIDDLIRIRREITDLVAKRETIIKNQGLDELFCLPDGNWHPDAANDYQQKYAALRDCEAGKIIDIIRPLSENYSGYHFPDDEIFLAENCWFVEQWLLMNGKHRECREGRWTIDDEPAGSNQRAIPSRFLYRPQRIPGEQGPIFDGVIVNKDTFTYQNYLNLMIDEGIISKLDNRKPPVIVEIGGGYGALALAFSQILDDDVLYIICDIPESLMFSGLYLALAERRVHVAGNGVVDADRGGIVLVPNYRFNDLAGALSGNVDLAINTLSMSEMSVHQVKTYGAGISGMIGGHGIFFEHNYDNHLLDRMIDCKDHLAEFFLFRKQIGHRGLCDLWSNADRH